MADNTQLNTGSGGDLIRTLARTGGASVGAKTEVVQLDLGGGDANSEQLMQAGIQTTANSVPVVMASDQGPVPVSGTVMIGNPQGDWTQAVPVLGQVTADITAVGGVPLAVGVTALPVSIATTLPVSLAGTQAVLDLVSATALGTPSDAQVYGPASGSIIAQLKGVNDAIQTLVALQGQQLSLLNSILQQLNSTGAQLGAAPTIPNVTIQ